MKCCENRPRHALDDGKVQCNVKDKVMKRRRREANTKSYRVLLIPQLIFRRSSIFLKIPQISRASGPGKLNAEGGISGSYYGRYEHVRKAQMGIFLFAFVFVSMYS